MTGLLRGAPDAPPRRPAILLLLGGSALAAGVPLLLGYTSKRFLGFDEVATIRCFRKPLYPPDTNGWRAAES